MRSNFFWIRHIPNQIFNLIDSLPTKMPCTTTDTLTIQDIEPKTNNQHQISRPKKKESKMKRCDEIWKLHNIKLNLISTLSLIDGWFHYAYTFSVKIKKKPFSRNEIHFIWIWMRKFNLHQIIHFLWKTFAHLIVRMRLRTIQFLQTFSYITKRI